jgi:hypothetical protein
MSCAKEEPAQQPARPGHGKVPADLVAEQNNLLDITRGAALVSRTGEAALPVSAINVIDGNPDTFWTPPAHDYPQSMVIALGAPARIDRVGFRSITFSGFQAEHVIFERSLDGAAWQPLVTMTARGADEAQWADVGPADAGYLRVTVPDTKTPGRDARLETLFARGTEIGERHESPLDGCWSMNGISATFAQKGTSATGVVAQRVPVFLAGGTDGRMWRFNWIRGNDYGYTALTVAPDGKHFSALNWHEEAIPLFVALPWFGERAPCDAMKPRDDVLTAVLRRAGHVSMFALRFDAGGRLLADSSREELQSLANIMRTAPRPLRVVAHEFRQADAKRNKDFAAGEIASLRHALATLGADVAQAEWVAAGSDAPRQKPESTAARAIYSSVEVEVRR